MSLLLQELTNILFININVMFNIYTLGLLLHGVCRIPHSHSHGHSHIPDRHSEDESEEEIESQVSSL